MLSALQYPNECETFYSIKTEVFKSSEFNNRYSGKVTDGDKKGKKKKKGNKRILIRTYFNYSIEAFELFGGSYRVHQSDYTQVKEKKPIH